MEIHADDIMDYYIDADGPTKQCVSLILEKPSIRWMISVVDSEFDTITQDSGSRVGYGLYKSELALLPQLMNTMLLPFKPGTDEFDLIESAIAVWIVKTGGDISLHRLAEKVQTVLDYED